MTRYVVNRPYFLTLIHLPTQKTQTYCSVASSVMVLNSLASDRAPVDPAYGRISLLFLTLLSIIYFI